MNKFVIPAVAAFALLTGSAVTGSAVAADQQPQAGQQVPQAGQHELIGMEVVGQGGEDLGEIQNVLVDRDGKVQSVIIQHGTAVLGMGGQQVAVPYDRLRLPEAMPGTPSDEQQARIDMTEEQIGELPEFQSEREMRGDRDRTGTQPGTQPGQPGTTGAPGATGTTGTTGTPGTDAGQQRR